jgi:hypothetical protein
LPQRCTRATAGGFNLQIAGVELIDSMHVRGAYH